VRKLYIPRDKEAHNMIVVGATGTRKSSSLLGLADQAIGRGWPCLFTDLKGGKSYVSEYYKPDVDYLINFADARCARWMLHDEFTSRLEAKTIAHAIIKERENSIPFFLDGAREMLAFLLGCLRLPVTELVALCKHKDKLQDALYGSGLENLLEGEGEGPYGFLGNLGNAVAPLGLLPQEDGKEFCIREWCKAGKQRKGNIFFVSSPSDFPAQQNLQALMIDMLLAGMQQYPGPGCCIFDEIGVYGEIPTYEKALTINRSSGNPIISAFQNFSQLRLNYGPERTKTIVSNPAIKVVLAMDEPEEAKYSADLLGLPSQLMRVKESRDANQFKDWEKQHHSYSSELPMESAVLGGEVQMKEDGHGYVKIRGIGITKIEVAWRPSKQGQPGFVPRVWPEWIAPEKPEKPPKEPGETTQHKPYKTKCPPMEVPV
jgi:hypothetical protein